MSAGSGSSYVHHPDRADHAAGRVADVLALLVHDPDFAVRTAGPVLDLLAVASVAERAGISGVHRHAVVRVDRRQEGS